jgi:hypothetical protein
VRHFALGESFDKAFHAVQAAPFSFAVDLLNLNLGTIGLEGFDFGEVASGVRLTSILCPHCILARGGVHLALV